MESPYLKTSVHPGFFVLWKAMIDATIYPEEFPRDDFDRTFTKMVHRIPHDLFKGLRKRLTDSRSFLRGKAMCLELVVDTNILFQEVRSVVTNGSSFFMKICDSPFVKLYGPTELRKELLEKIRLKFPKDKKTREIPEEQYVKVAEQILSKVFISEDICHSARRRADEHLKDRDLKDAPFLALGFSIEAHGILSKDKDYGVQDEIKTYNLSDTGKVVTEFGKGSVSVLVLEASLPAIFELIRDIISAIWGAFVSAVLFIARIFVGMLRGSIELIWNLPTPFLLIAGAGILYLMFNEKAQESARRIFDAVWSVIKDMVKAISKFFKEVWEFLKMLWEALKPFVKGAAGILLYLTEQSMIASNTIEGLENARPTEEE